MLYLTTGTPGAGKTLWTIATVEARRIKESRPVYYFNIKGLALEWVELTLEQVLRWWELPHGSIIVIDEAQDVFPKGSASGKPPEHADRIAKHRHGGFDIYLVSQHPMKLDANVRKDVEEHRHLMRKFGSHWVTVHLWKGSHDNCDKTRKDSIASQWRYPKEVFAWYKSAEVHTVKRTIPLKVLAGMVGIPAVIVGLGWYVVGGGREWLRGTPDQPKAAQAPAPSPAAAASRATAPGRPTGARQGSYQAPATPQAYMASYKPRIEGLPHTAPRYDELTAPVRAPHIVGCWLTESGKAGWCVTQQGNRLKLPPHVMASFIENGTFHDFEEGPAPGANPTGSGQREAGGQMQRQAVLPGAS